MLWGPTGVKASSKYVDEIDPWLPGKASFADPAFEWFCSCVLPIVSGQFV